MDVSPNLANGELAYTSAERLLVDFVSRGIVVLAPETLGVPEGIHQIIYEKEKRAFSDNRSTVTAASIPEILQIVEAPGVVAAVDRLLGENWAVVPFTHNAPFTSGAHDQHWHKDDNGPFNGRKQRHHQAVQVEMLYYPQEVREDMGPTATVPFSQYWAFNHEENHDNFAGADHLDFAYHLSGMERIPVSGPKSNYDAAQIRERRTRHDIRMRSAIENTGWPLVRQLEVGPLRAGSVVLYSHNLFHRGNHRRDDWRTWQQRPRFMWRFWLYRTKEPEGESASDAAGECDWNGLGIDPLTGQDLAQASSDATAVWRQQYQWIRSGQAVPPERQRSASTERPCAAPSRAEELYEQMQTMGEAAEPRRIGAAYKLAALEDKGLAAQLLGRALHHERESVRRAASYGLAALGPAATDVLVAAASAPLKWVRKGALFALGDAGRPTLATTEVIAARLRDDASVYVRSVAATALGCLGRRAIAAGTDAAVVPACASALVESLGRERNRLAMNIAQDRHIKIVRPTDECDVCEGIGINYGLDRFRPIRSAVRENALWSLVILCSHGARAVGAALPPLVAALAQVVEDDRNIFSVGSALDALNRLARLHPTDCSAEAGERCDALLARMPIRSWESLVRGGLPALPVPEATAPTGAS